MSNDAPSSPSTKAPGWRALFRMCEHSEADWGRVRAAQLNALIAQARIRLLLNLVAIIGVIFLLKDVQAMALLIGWSVWSVGVTLFGLYLGITKSQWEHQTVTLTALHGETFYGLLVAIGWAILPAVFMPMVEPSNLITIWALCAIVMMGFGYANAPLPAAAILGVLVMGSGLTIGLWRIHQPISAILSITMMIGMIGAAFRLGRTFVMQAVAQIALAEKNEVVSLLLREFDDSGGDWMWQTDASKCLTHVSPRFAYALGVEAISLERQPILKILASDAWESGDFSAPLRELSDKLKKQDSFSNLTLPVTIRGEVRWWELSASPRYDDRGRFIGYRGVGSDVTAQRRSADKINQMARFDPLTGLPNRLQITETLVKAMQEAERWRSKCAFMMIDLDRFKAVNDTLGHPVGDRLLTRVAERLKSLMRDQNLCGRLGGDEFAVVIPDATDTAALNKLARTIIETLSRPYEVDHHTLYIGASIGSAIGPRDGRSVETLIRSADLALYRSKDQGGNIHHAYEPQLHVHAEERRVLEIALRKALERQEFHIHYQPVVSAENGTIESFEALLRWRHPELGDVSPARFIPVAEDARLIAPIGEWVLRSACEEATQWPEIIRVAVNVSAEQLTHPNFLNAIVSALAHSRIDASRLELEVTESVFLRDSSSVVAVLEQIMAMGVRLSLDDFGTGYSSLGYLSKTRFNTIKIDRSFVQGAARNMREATAIIRAVVALADSLGMTTTAEGVETDIEYEMVRRLGCRKIQGYLFGRPMPPEAVKRLFEDRRRAQV